MSRLRRAFGTPIPRYRVYSLYQSLYQSLYYGLYQSKIAAQIDNQDVDGLWILTIVKQRRKFEREDEKQPLLHSTKVLIKLDQKTKKNSNPVQQQHRKSFTNFITDIINYKIVYCTYQLFCSGANFNGHTCASR